MIDFAVKHRPVPLRTVLSKMAADGEREEKIVALETECGECLCDTRFGGCGHKTRRYICLECKVREHHMQYRLLALSH